MIVDVTVGLHHAESIVVVGEIVSILMVPYASLVRNVGGNGFDLSHEFVSDARIVTVHVVSKISHMQDRIDGSFLGFILKERDRVPVDVSCEAEFPASVSSERM